MALPLPASTDFCSHSTAFSSSWAKASPEEFPWGLSLCALVYRRFLSTRDGTRDTTFGLQLVLKGMTSLGTAADRMLERGILGYSSLLD